MRRAFLLLRRRLVTSIPGLLIVVFGTFFLLEAAPGDAVDPEGGVEDAIKAGQSRRPVLP